MDTNRGWALTTNEVYRTTDGGSNWIDLGSVGSAENLFSIHFTDTSKGWVFGRRGMILRTTTGGGDTTGDGDPTTLAEDREEDPEPIRLYPNPAERRVTIGYEASRKGPVRLTLRNTLGQLIIERQEEVSRGENRLHMNVGTLEKGLYFLGIKNEKGKRKEEKLFVE